MQVQNVNAANSVAPIKDAIRSEQRADSTTVAQVQSRAIESVGEQSAETIRSALERVNEIAKTLKTGLEFTIDDDTKIQIVKVTDIESKDVIRQIPTEEVVRISKAIDQLKGLLLSEKA
ncbi:flagellar protein FlaG [Chitinibacter sp. SCUT-21]|uniref:flagellar protein FlaG n=1 Tax=Chitinibacter sp. SCUT-21 TaxID=2970891 RepID=UPI0035A6EA83